MYDANPNYYNNTQKLNFAQVWNKSKIMKRFVLFFTDAKILYLQNFLIGQFPCFSYQHKICESKKGILQLRIMSLKGYVVLYSSALLKGAN